MRFLLLLCSMLFVFEAYAAECHLRRVGRYMTKNMDYRPNYIQARYQGTIQQDTNLTLFRRKTNSPPVLDLAQGFRVDAKNKKLIVTLKQNCGWSDGVTITAPDMLKGIQLAFSGVDVPLTRFAPFFKNASDVQAGKKEMGELGVRAVDDFTLEFDLVISPDLLIQALTFPSFTPAPLHLMDKNPSVWPSKSIVRVSSGAYYATSYTPKLIKLKRNDYFCSAMPVSFETVDYIGENNETLWPRKVVLDEIDIAHDVRPKQAAIIVKNMGEDDLTMGRFSERIVVYLSIRMKNEHLKENNVRQAIKEAINYAFLDRITSNIKSDASLNGIVPIYPDYIRKNSYVADGDYLKYNIEKAQKLMQDVGYGPNNRIKLTLLNTQGDLLKTVRAAVSSMLKQVYIDVDIEEEWTDDEQLSKLYSGDYEMVIAGWGPDIDDPSNYLEGVVDYFMSPSALRDTAKAKIKQSYQIYDQKERFNILAGVEKDIMDSNQIIPLLEKKSSYLIRSGYKFLDEPIMSARTIVKEGCPKANRQ